MGENNLSTDQKIEKWGKEVKAIFERLAEWMAEHDFPSRETKEPGGQNER